LLTYNARAGDAIGNHVAEKLSFFLDSGADVRVFVESDFDLHPSIRSHCRLLAPEPRGDGWRFLLESDLVIVDYSQAYSLLSLLPLLVGRRRRIVLDYHSVTPPEFWEGSSAEALVHGVRSRGLVWCADAAFVHSRFARSELLKPTSFPDARTFAMGYAVNRDFWTAPSRHDFRVRLGLGPSRLLLFIGRLAPNKRVPLLVEVLDRLRDVEPPVHAAVIGDDTDVYQAEAERCRARARELGISDRLHLLGRLPIEQLREAYHSADVFVMPSRHEGFCLPIIEAMACGVPVLAARAAALPETVGDAGLTFNPDDVDDLAGQIRRVFDSQAASKRLPLSAVASNPLSICIVAPRYGDDFAGGAERSLRAIAEALHAAGHRVEVFTTCARSDGEWKNDYQEGTSQLGGVPVHRFHIDAGQEQSELRCTHLLEVLTRVASDFDTIITGPYLPRLPRDVAAAFPEKTLVLPCFHDELAARAPRCRTIYGQTAGMLYHSAEEQTFAEAELGLNHSNAHVIGTYLEPPPSPRLSEAKPGGAYVVYCGRYSDEKGLPPLLDLARDYARRHPDRFKFVFMGDGAVAIPKEPWARDLGFVSEEVKREVLAGAAALIHWSERESLSLVALEAWAQATPLICNAGCAVLAGHLERCGGGVAAADAEAFTRALDDLWEHADEWQGRGEAGQRYVRAHYMDRTAFTAAIVRACDGMKRPLVERLRERSLRRAEHFTRDAWRAEFATALEQVLDLPARELREQLEVTPRSDTHTVSIATTSVLVPVRVTNRGSHPVLADGAARRVLRSYLAGEETRIWRPGGPETPLPALLMPGQSHAAAIPLTVPATPGIYHVALHAERAENSSEGTEKPQAAFDASSSHLLILKVTDHERESESCCAPLLEQVHVALAEAHALQRLPDNYIDVSTGRFATFKRWIKRKILGNFKRAYVDVLSRQQSGFNQKLLHALQELSECCATLDHVCSNPTQTLRGASTPQAEPARPGGRVADPEVLKHMLRNLAEQLVETRQRNEQLHDRIARLEDLLNRKGVA
jgi:glycosyltransferase involved in cell wall biosynthesis